MSAAGPSVLVVDDDDDIRETIIESLGDEGLAAAGAADGAAALSMLKSAEHKPGLILLDLMMPGMSGAEFRERQLADPELARIPVVVLTADANAQSKSIELRADGCLEKPLTLASLIETVERYCAPEGA
jgi:CheY-like chemotaxis protein